MKTTKTFENASLVSVMNGSVIVKSAAGIEHTFTNASVVSVNNGTIIVETEWEPKRGELVKVLHSGINCYVIFDEIKAATLFTFGSKEIRGCYSKLGDDSWVISRNTEIHPVTPEEQQAFDDFCKSQGKVWNKETLQWEKYRWKPLMGDWYYYIDHSNPDIVGRHRWANDLIDNRYYNNYNHFQTREKALEAAKEVKKLLKSL